MQPWLLRAPLLVNLSAGPAITEHVCHRHLVLPWQALKSGREIGQQPAPATMTLLCSDLARLTQTDWPHLRLEPGLTAHVFATSAAPPLNYTVVVNEVHSEPPSPMIT